MNVRARTLSIIISNLLLTLALLMLIEGALAFMLAAPGVTKFAPEKVRNMAHYIYMKSVNIIQYRPECARYDSYLTYTLKPDHCVFSNQEFRNEIWINSLGVRDDEASLVAPEIIVAGDSHAMGWGVNQDETFAHIIEQESGMTVLNTAISSYGTVREMRLLDRVNTSNLQYLVIQYSDNDYRENRSFYENNNDLPIMSEDTYNRLRDNANARKRRRYYLGKHSITLFKILLDFTNQRIHGPTNTSKSRKDETELFLNAFMKASRVNFTHTKVIVMEIADGRGNIDDQFITSLQKRIASHTYPAFIEHLTAIDVSAKLDHDDYYLLDNHINTKGHKIIANLILNVISQNTEKSTAPGDQNNQDHL